VAKGGRAGETAPTTGLVQAGEEGAEAKAVDFLRRREKPHPLRPVFRLEGVVGVVRGVRSWASEEGLSSAALLSGGGSSCPSVSSTIAPWLAFFAWVKVWWYSRLASAFLHTPHIPVTCTAQIRVRFGT
jgi:hypothetical protein